MRRTAFAGAAADEAEALAALADAEALDADADALDALAEAEALAALPDPLEHATMNSANIAANTAATNALILTLFFIVSLPF